MKRLFLLALVFAPLVSCPPESVRWPTDVMLQSGVVVYVPMLDERSFYKIDQRSGEVWICAGDLMTAMARGVNWDGQGRAVATGPDCRGLDGTLNPSPAIAMPRAGYGLSHNPPTTQWTTLSRDPSPRTLTFCGMFRSATKERQRLVCAAAGVVSEPACRDLCLQERTK